MKRKINVNPTYNPPRFKNAFYSFFRGFIIILSTGSFMSYINACGCGGDGAKDGPPAKKRPPSVIYNRDAFSGLGGVLLISAGGPLISGDDGRYAVFLDFDKRELTAFFLKGVRRRFYPRAGSPSRDRVYFEGRFIPPAVEGKRVIPTIFDRAYLIGEYDIKTKAIRYLFLGPFINGGFGYSPVDNTIIFDGFGWAEAGSPENPIRHHVFRLDVASGRVEEIIGSWNILHVDAVADSGRFFLLSEREEAFSETRFFIYDYKGRRLKTVPVSYEDGVLDGRYLSDDGKRIAFTRKSRGRSIHSFSVNRYARGDFGILFIQGKWLEEYRRWFRGPHCFSPDGRYLIVLFAKYPWPCEYSEVTLVLYDLDTGEYDWLVKAEFAPTSLYLDWQQ